jgi:trimeric autotransporter adhesin
VERLFYWSPGRLRGLDFAGEDTGVTVLRAPGSSRAAATLRAAAMLCLLAIPMLVWAQPALTTIADTIYRADGTAAAGVALISWPAFQTAAGNAVAAGTKTVMIGAGGTFSTQLMPNVGATPVGAYYTVVFQLDDGTVRREYWAVPTTSPATIAEVRTTPGTGVANGLVSKQYVDSAVANRRSIRQ